MTHGELEDNFTAIDVELANTDLHTICEVGVARFRGGELVETWRVLIDPEAEYGQAYHSNLHGIRAFHTAGAAKFSEIHSTLQRFLEGEHCVYHAASRFDPNCISHACQRYGLQDLTSLATWTSTLDLAHSAWRSEPSYKLSELCAKFGHDYLPHNALEDAIACAVLYRAASGTKRVPAIAAAGQADGRQRTFRKVPTMRRQSGLEGNSEGKYAGTFIVYSGIFSPPYDDRTTFESYLCSLGFTPRAGFSKKTKYLIIGEGAGTKKIEKAQELGIPVLTEADFLKKIEED